MRTTLIRTSALRRHGPARNEVPGLSRPRCAGPDVVARLRAAVAASSSGGAGAGLRPGPSSPEPLARCPARSVLGLVPVEGRSPHRTSVGAGPRGLLPRLQRRGGRHRPGQPVTQQVHDPGRSTGEPVAVLHDLLDHAQERARGEQQLAGGGLQMLDAFGAALVVHARHHGRCTAARHPAVTGRHPGPCRRRRRWRERDPEPTVLQARRTDLTATQRVRQHQVPAVRPEGDEQLVGRCGSGPPRPAR